MPIEGYGVYQVTPEESERCVSDALKVGYRMTDTAQAYNNEDGAGAAIAKSGIDRKDLFLVSKIWLANYGYEKAKASIDESLRKLGTDYIDLMLLHQPFCDRYGAYPQVALRWLTQRGIIIPKSTHVERMEQNLDIYDFTLSEEEMSEIAKLDTGTSLFFDHHSAEVTKMFMGWR